MLSAARAGTRSDGKAQTHLVRHVSKRRIVEVIGRIPADLMEALDGRLREVLGLQPQSENTRTDPASPF
ncbi:type II toxin-antitoxin system PemK/MazF family toxin [Oceanithermus sp.]